MCTYRCLLCGFETDLDDVVVGNMNGRCICLRCYAHEVADEHPMPPPLRREVVATLAVIE